MALPLAVPLVLGGASAATRLAKGFFGLFSSIKKDRAANEILKNTKRPIYNRPEEINDVANLAASELSSNDTVDFVKTNAESGLSQGIDAILKSGGTADFSTIMNKYGQDLNQAAATVLLDRSRRVANYNNAVYNVAKAKDAEFMYNKDAPFKDNMQRVGQLKAESAKEKASFFTETSGALADMATAFSKPGKYGGKGGGAAAVESAAQTNVPQFFTPPTSVDPPVELPHWSTTTAQTEPDQMLDWVRMYEGRTE